MQLREWAVRWLVGAAAFLILDQVATEWVKLSYETHWARSGKGYFACNGNIKMWGQACNIAKESK